MSVRELPVSNRYIDLIDKEEKYRKHMTVLARAKPTINTTQPETARRILMADKKSKDYRRNLMRNMKAHNQLMTNVSPQQTKQKRTYNFDWNAMSAKRPVQHDEFADIDLFQNDYDRFRPTTQLRSQRTQLHTSSSSSSSEFKDPSDVSECSDSNEDFEFQPSINSSRKAVSISSKSSSIKPKVRNETIRIGYAPEERQKDEKVTKLNTSNPSTSVLKTLTEIHDLDNTQKSSSRRSSSRLSSKSKSSISEKAESLTSKSKSSHAADMSSQNSKPKNSSSNNLSSSGFNSSEKLSKNSNSSNKKSKEKSSASDKLSDEDLDDFDKNLSSNHSAKNDTDKSSHKSDLSLGDSEIDKLANSSASEKSDNNDKKESSENIKKISSDDNGDDFDNFDDFN